MVEDEGLFLGACGGDGPLRLRVEGPGSPEDDGRTFGRPFVVIGRAPACDLVLDHEDVSKRHVYLQRIGGRLFFTDLGSRTGIHAGEGRVRSGWLGAGATIRVGPYAIRAVPGDGEPAEPEGAGEALNPLESNRDAPGDLPPVTLEFLRPGSEVVAWRMSRVLALVGRAPECRVRLAGSSVSSFHCGLLRTPAGVWAVDLLGREGIAVNGQAVRSARLDEGDVLRVGRHRVRLRGASPGSAGNGTALAVRRGPGMPAARPSRRAIAVASGPAEIAPFPELSGAADVLLGHMTGQFSLIQQQMFDQFQQTMMMMAEMFGALHRDQAESVRAELERLRQLNQDLAALQGELTARRDASPPAPASGPEPPALPDRAARPSGLPKAGPKPTEGAKASPPRPRVDGPASSPAPAGDAIHAQLNRRIAEIQQERQGRFQRLIDLMSRSTGGPVP